MVILSIRERVVYRSYKKKHTRSVHVTLLFALLLAQIFASLELYLFVLICPHSHFAAAALDQILPALVCF